MDSARLRSVIFNVANDSLWHRGDGVYNGMFLDCEFILQTRSYFDGKGIDNGGHYIVRALASLYERNKTSSDLREYIKEYIGVQVSLLKPTSPDLHNVVLGCSIMLSSNRLGPQAIKIFMGYPGQDHETPRLVAFYRPRL